MCTTVGFRYKEGYVFGRTLEMGVKMDHDVLFVPGGSEELIVTEEGCVKTRFAVLGTGFMGQAAFGDGINFAGLMGSNNLLPGYASFAETAAAGKVNLTLSHAFNYLLSRCADVAEVRREAESLHILKQNSAGELSMDMHFFFMDANGDGVVLEPKDGRLCVYDNPYGVLTNAPEFPWHTVNLKNYLHLQADNVEQTDWNGVTLSKFGEGSGLVGLPGDFTPPSRFVRAAFFVSATPKNLKRNAAILQGFRILSQSDIPKGAVIDPKEGYMDETLYTSVMDTKERAYYVKCHDNIHLQKFTLSDFADVCEIRHVKVKKEMEL